MNVEELTALEIPALALKVKALEEEVFRVRFQHATSQLQNPNQLRITRRALARAKTILRQKELGR